MRIHRLPNPSKRDQPVHLRIRHSQRCKSIPLRHEGDVADTVAFRSIDIQHYKRIRRTINVLQLLPRYLVSRPPNLWDQADNSVPNVVARSMRLPFAGLGARGPK
jgi:hypothetical protein